MGHFIGRIFPTSQEYNEHKCKSCSMRTSEKNVPYQKNFFTSFQNPIRKIFKGTKDTRQTITEMHWELYNNWPFVALKISFL